MGEISLITGFYFGLDYDRINTVERTANPDGYKIIYSYNKLGAVLDN